MREEAEHVPSWITRFQNFLDTEQRIVTRDVDMTFVERGSEFAAETSGTFGPTTRRRLHLNFAHTPNYLAPATEYYRRLSSPKQLGNGDQEKVLDATEAWGDFIFTKNHLHRLGSLVLSVSLLVPVDEIFWLQEVERLNQRIAELTARRDAFVLFEEEEERGRKDSE